MIDQNIRYSILQTRVRLKRSGKHILSRRTYDKMIANGILEKPIRHKGLRPFHTWGQIERAILRLITPPEEKSVKRRGWLENLEAR